VDALLLEQELLEDGVTEGSVGGVVALPA